MDIIRVNTPRGLELKGAMFGNNTMESVVIIMSGTCSNLFQNDLLLASVLTAQWSLSVRWHLE